jgi:hypothetical protein
MTSKKTQVANNAESGVTTATPEKALPAANIKFIGRDVWDKGKRKILKAAAPIDRYSDAGELVLLPPADFQKRQRLFYHEQAGRIAAAFPHLYKILRSK